MPLVIDRELVNDSNKTPRPRLQILEHAIAAGQTVTDRPVAPRRNLGRRNSHQPRHSSRSGRSGRSGRSRAGTA